MAFKHPSCEREEFAFIGNNPVESAVVLDVITSTPELGCLGLTFDTPTQQSPIFHLILKATVGNFYWSSLKTVRLDGLTLDEDELVEFCERHACTLKNVELKDMQMCRGTWYIAFHRMRRVFSLGQQLDTCRVGGLFMSPMASFDVEEGSDWDIDATGISNLKYIQDKNVGDISFREYHEVMGLSWPASW